jgi:hypothetical protein
MKSREGEASDYYTIWCAPLSSPDSYTTFHSAHPCADYLRNSHARMTSAGESLHGQDLIVQVVGIESVFGPEVEVVGHGYSAR